MKNSLLYTLVALATLLCSCAGSKIPYNQTTATTYWNLPSEVNQIAYIGQIKNTKSKALNHKQVFDFIATNYRNANSVIAANNGVDLIVVNGIFPFTWNTGYGYQRISMHHRLVFNSSDSAIQYRIIDLSVKYTVPGTSGTVSGGTYIRGMADTNVDEPLEVWLGWRSENKKQFIESDFKPFMESFTSNLKTSLK